MTSIEDVGRDVMITYNQFLLERLKQVPVGSILCVHEEIVHRVQELFWSNDMKMTFSMMSHVIEGVEFCRSDVNKTQFGPVTVENREALLEHQTKAQTEVVSRWCPLPPSLENLGGAGADPS